MRVGIITSSIAVPGPYIALVQHTPKAYLKASKIRRQVSGIQYSAGSSHLPACLPACPPACLLAYHKP